jgi:hypothetical protein
VTRVAARGWTADWLNAWLAAIGATVLVDGLLLHWSDDARPHAIFTADVAPNDLTRILAANIPSDEELKRYALATSLQQAGGELKRNAPLDVFAQRADYARQHADPSLGIALTDLGDDRRKAAHASAFYKGGPGPVGTIHDRLLALLNEVDPVALDRSMAGELPRIEKFGLGFDALRFIDPSYAIDTGSWVDPVVELLAFFGMLLFPVRGNGKRVRTRGWRYRDGEEVFEWIAWPEPLSVSGIDALLDMLDDKRLAGQRYLSVTRTTGGEYAMVGYGSVPC